MKKKLLTAAVCAALALSLAAAPLSAEFLSDTAEGIAQFEGLSANEVYDFQIVLKSVQVSYWKAVSQGMDRARDELGVTYNVQGPAAASDVAEQVEMLNNCIDGTPAGVGLAACDPASVRDSLQRAIDKGVPVVALDTGITDAPEGAVVCTIVTDNSAAGALAADKLYEAVRDKLGNGPVRVVELNQDSMAQNIQSRGLGFINRLIELAKAEGFTLAVEGNEFYVNGAEGAAAGSADIILEVRVPAETNVDLCAAEASAVLDKPDTIAVFASSQTAAEGLLAADEGRKVLGSSIVGVGFDAGTPIKTAVADGTLLGAVTQSPLMLGYYCIYALTAAANGQELIDVPADGYWYDASNMEDEAIAPNLYD